MQELPRKNKCVTAKINGKALLRSELTENIKRSAQRIYANQELYRNRQALVEYPFGNIERLWGFDYIMIKKVVKAASADSGLIAIAYNLRRLSNLKLFNTTLHKASKGILRH